MEKTPMEEEETHQQIEGEQVGHNEKT